MNQQQKEHVVREISRLLSTLSDNDKKELAQKLFVQDAIPLSVFTAPLSAFEILVKFLKEHSHLSFKQISRTLNRQPSTIYATYSNACKKYTRPLDVSDFTFSIPLHIFSNRQFSNLELVVAYLKEKYNLSFSVIAASLERSHHTCRTVYWRYRLKKRGIKGIEKKK